MRAPVRVRLLLVPLVWLPAGLLVWAYIATHDLARTWRQLQAGRHVTWPPATKPGAELEPAAHVAQLLATAGAVLWPAAVAVLVLALYVSSEATLMYPRRRLLWLACPVLMYWLTRYWFLAQRRETHDDPVVFALKDGRSLLAGLATALIVAAASLRL